VAIGIIDCVICVELLLPPWRWRCIERNGIDRNVPSHTKPRKFWGGQLA